MKTLIICSGMQRAASNWQYQLACEFVRRFVAGPHQFHGDTEGTIPSIERQPAEAHVIKTHDYVGSKHMKGADRIITFHAVRDPSTLACSYARAAGVSVRAAHKAIPGMIYDSIDWMEAYPNGYVMIFEKMMSSPVAEAQRMCAHLRCDEVVDSGMRRIVARVDRRIVQWMASAARAGKSVRGIHANHISGTSLDIDGAQFSSNCAEITKWKREFSYE